MGNIKKYIIILVIILAAIGFHYGNKFYKAKTANFSELNQNADNFYKMALNAKNKDINKTNEYYTLAIDNYNKALFVKPNADYKIYLNLADIYADQNNWQMVNKIIQKAISYHPFNNDLYDKLSHYKKLEIEYKCKSWLDEKKCSTEKTKTNKEIINMFNKLVDKNPADKESYSSLARALAENNQHELAINYFEQSLTKNLNEDKLFECSVYKDIGDIYKNKDDYRKALDYYNKSKKSLSICPYLAQSMRDLVNKLKVKYPKNS